MDHLHGEEMPEKQFITLLYWRKLQRWQQDVSRLIPRYSRHLKSFWISIITENMGRMLITVKKKADAKKLDGYDFMR
jgi:hypothetical protein